MGADSRTGPRLRVSRLPLRGGTIRQRRTRASIALLTPALLLWGVVFLAPLLLMVWMSLNNWPLFGNIRFAGFDNYVDALSDSDFWDSVAFTIRYTAIITPIQVIGGYLLAMLVRDRWKGAGAFRSIYFMPVVIGFAAAAFVFISLVQPGFGLVDGLFDVLGLKSANVPLLSDPTLALAAAVMLNAWKSIGIAMILFMAGMQGISNDLYDAAQVDGAGRAARERFITIPLLRPTLALVLILIIAGSLLAFDQFYILTRGGPQGETTTAVLWIYTVSFVRFRLGYGAALSVILLLIIVCVTALQVRVLREQT